MTEVPTPYITTYGNESDVPATDRPFGRDAAKDLHTSPIYKLLRASIGDLGSISFTVPGNPIPKGRPRVMLRPGRKATAYTPASTRRWEATVKDAAILAMADRDPFTGPVEVVLWFYRENRRRVDGDNIEKGCLDPMSGVVWVDDDQVVNCHWFKRLDPANPRLEVTVRALNEVEL